jgi:hypothetical protein
MRVLTETTNISPICLNHDEDVCQHILCGILSSGMLRSISDSFFTDVSGQDVGHIFMDKNVSEERILQVDR